ncbi:unnamed protein product [Sympodiomycopsis kandeliae]
MTGQSKPSSVNNYSKILETLSLADKALDVSALAVEHIPLCVARGARPLWWRFVKQPKNNSTGMPSNHVTQSFCILMANLEVLRMAWLLKHKMRTDQQLLHLFEERLEYDVVERVWCHCSTAFAVATRKEIQAFRKGTPAERAALILEETQQTAQVPDEHIKSLAKKIEKFLSVPHQVKESSRP